jgi:hypothetical protein
MKEFEDFFKRITRDIFAKIKDRTPVKTGRLKRSLELGYETGEDGHFKERLRMLYYGKFVDEGHWTRNRSKFIQGKHFTEPMRKLKEIIPKLEKAYGEYITKQLAKEIKNNK